MSALEPVSELRAWQARLDGMSRAMSVAASARGRPRLLSSRVRRRKPLSRRELVRRSFLPKAG